MPRPHPQEFRQRAVGRRFTLEGHPQDDQAEWRRVTLQLLRILFLGSLEHAAAWFSRYSTQKREQAADALALYSELAAGSVRKR